MSTETVRGLNICILPSYVGLLYLLNRFSITDTNLIFLTSNKSLIKLLNGVRAKVIEIPVVRDDYSRKALSQIHQENRGIAAKFSDCKVIHFFYRNDIAGLSLIRMLSKNNTPVHIPLDPDAKRVWLFQLKSLRAIRKFGISQLAYLFIFGFRPNLFESDNSYFLGKKEKPAAEDLMGADSTLLNQNKKLLLKNIHLGDLEILYLDNASAHFPKAALQIVSILKDLEASGHKITVKPHPTFKPLDAFKSFELVPDELPAEICMSFAKIVLGFSTTALKTPLEVPVISLLKMVEVEQVPLQRYLNHLDSANILFPESLNELKKII